MLNKFARVLQTFHTDFLAQKEKAIASSLPSVAERACSLSPADCATNDTRCMWTCRLPRCRLCACASRARSTHGQPWRHATPITLLLSSVCRRTYAAITRDAQSRTVQSRTPTVSPVCRTGDSILFVWSHSFVSRSALEGRARKKLSSVWRFQFTRQVFKEQIFLRHVVGQLSFWLFFLSRAVFPLEEERTRKVQWTPELQFRISSKVSSNRRFMYKLKI